VKYLVILALAFCLALTQGCTSNDKDQAGPETSILKPAPAASIPASAGAAPISWPADPAANGGFALPAAAPYSQPGSAAASQTVNPAPFLAASRSSGTAGSQATPSGSLASRADGTLSGPQDHPAATTGW
jgi:hypothetical protein